MALRRQKPCSRPCFHNRTIETQWEKEAEGAGKEANLKVGTLEKKKKMLCRQSREEQREVRKQRKNQNRERCSVFLFFTSRCSFLYPLSRYACSLLCVCALSLPLSLSQSLQVRDVEHNASERRLGNRSVL